MNRKKQKQPMCPEEETELSLQQHLADMEANQKRYDRTFKHIMKTYNRAVAPALKRYRQIDALAQEELRRARSQNPENYQHLFQEYIKKRDEAYLQFTRETASQAEERNRKLAEALSNR